MLERLRRGIIFVKNWFQPQRRAALVALMKAGVMIGCLWEIVWYWHIHYYSRYFTAMPISLAWSMLSVIGAVTFAQMGCSAVLKLRSARLRRLSAISQVRITALLTNYVTLGDSEEELRRSARSTPRDFEECLTAALLGTRGAALDRLRELPAVTGLRHGWIQRSRWGSTLTRRYAVEHLALLRDPAAIDALETALSDPDSGVVAAAARGLLRIQSYEGRQQLIRSLPGRPFLVRVLTAGEDQTVEDEAPGSIAAAAAFGPLLLVASEAGQTRAAFAAAASFGTRKVAGIQELQMRAARQPDTAAGAERANCSTLASLGTSGQDLLRLMSATGLAGDAPAEALGEALAAAARGGRG